MGRRKISIAPIQDDRNRQVTFLKRKNGLFKKAYELGVLCSADVAVVVFNANGKLFEFHSGDMDAILLRYSHYAGPSHEKRGPEDYINKDLAASKKGMGGKMTTLSDEDDDDDDEPQPAAGSSGVKAIPASRGKQAIKAAQERKAKEASLSRPPSEEPSLSRPSSQMGHEQYQQPPPDLQQQPSGYPLQQQQLPPGSQQFGLSGLQYPSNAVGSSAGGLQAPGGAPQGFGFPPFGSASPHLAGLAGFPMGIPGLPPPPAFPNPFPQLPGFPGTFMQPGGTDGSGGVPSWFGAPNPQAAAAGTPQVNHAQLLQQFAGAGGAMAFPGWPDVAQQQQQFQQLQQQQLQQQQQQQQHQQPPPQQHMSSPPTVAPMYGSPAAGMSYSASPDAFAGQTPGSHSTPGSVSGHLVPPGGLPPPARQDSKPRLSVAIPAGSNAEEGKKPGLVTAGGASILGAGVPFVQEPEGAIADEEQGQATALPRSAFAADLLPSPFYPPGAGVAGTSLAASTAPSSSVFTWPTAPPGPAPMLGEGEAPDLLRQAGQAEGTGGLEGLSEAAMGLGGGGADGGDAATVNNLKRGSVDLEEGIGNMEVHEGEGSEVSEAGDGNAGRVRKRRG
ncbi:hypothetical protein JCM11251_001087 [Rhodosporidiobolus azoricus]